MRFKSQRSAESSNTEEEKSKDTNETGEVQVDADVIAHMVLIVQKTYYNSGFFNVPVGYSKFFGADLQTISIYCEGKTDPIIGFINRTANKNSSPRIMGGADSKRWFQSDSKEMGEIDVEILSPTSIKLVPRK
jgi:hypothetical protein